MVYVFFAEGYEEVEALTVVDLLRRAKIDTKMVSVTGNLEVTSSHGVKVTMDMLFEDIKEEADMLVLPGGMPGTLNLKAHKGLVDMIHEYHAKGKYLAAICAAPTVYGELGLLKDTMACCYPDMEDGLVGANVLYDGVVIDGKMITSRGLGTAIPFGLSLVGIFQGIEAAEALAKKIVYNAEEEEE